MNISQFTSSATTTKLLLTHLRNQALLFQTLIARFLGTSFSHAYYFHPFSNFSTLE